MRLTLLGTGTPTPNPERQGSANLLEVGGQYLLFDAGRGPKFTYEVQHRYKPELRWARDMTSSILMIVLRFPGCMRPGDLVVRSAK